MRIKGPLVPILLIIIFFGFQVALFAKIASYPYVMLFLFLSLLKVIWWGVFFMKSSLK